MIAPRMNAPRQRQTGVAIITALLVVMLAASIAAFLLAQQSHALTRTVRAGERAQALLYAQATLDWARAALFQLQKATPRVDLTQQWAQGLNAIPIDGAVAAGVLRDEAGLFNLNNLIRDGNKSAPDIAVFRRLLTDLKLNPDLANAVTDWIDSDDEPTLPGGAEAGTYIALKSPYRPANQRLLQADELRRVFGFDEEEFNRLAPFVTALPAQTKININTAPQEVLHALFPELSNEEIVALMKARLGQPFNKLDGDGSIKSALKTVPATTIDKLADFRSQYFQATIAIDNGGAQVRQSALLQRAAVEGGAINTWPAIIWVKTE